MCQYVIYIIIAKSTYGYTIGVDYIIDCANGDRQRRHWMGLGDIPSLLIYSIIFGLCIVLVSAFRAHFVILATANLVCLILLYVFEGGSKNSISVTLKQGHQTVFQSHSPKKNQPLVFWKLHEVPPIKCATGRYLKNRAPVVILTMSFL